MTPRHDPSAEGHRVRLTKQGRSLSDLAAGCAQWGKRVGGIVLVVSALPEVRGQEGRPAVVTAWLHARCYPDGIQGQEGAMAHGVRTKKGGNQ